VKAPRVTAATPYEQWPLFMTVHEVAIVSGRSYKALLNRMPSGRGVPAVKVAGEYRVHRDVVYARLLEPARTKRGPQRCKAA
jgi:hypothetical protein